MEEIKLYIITSSNTNKNVLSKKSLDNSLLNQSFEDLKIEYETWIQSLFKLMKSHSYRQAINEIEEKSHLFESLKSEIWKHKIIKLKAIIKIIKIKVQKYTNEIKKENSYQNRSVKFWINQCVLLLENLQDSINIDKNNINDHEILIPIRYIFHGYLELIYLLAKLSSQLDEIQNSCLYLSFIDYFMPYISYLIDFRSFYLIQLIFLFRAKILLENQNYLLFFEYQKEAINTCNNTLLLIKNKSEDEKFLKNYYIQKYLKKQIYLNIINLIIAYFLRGVACENLGDLIKAVKAYKECTFLAFNYLIDISDLFNVFLSKIENIGSFYVNIISDIKILYKQTKNKKLRKNSKTKTNKTKKPILLNSKNRCKSALNKRSPIKTKYKLKSAIRESTNKQLESYLDKIGKELYKEEENRNNNLIKKFTKSKFILSTVEMINDYLSRDFLNIVQKMDKIEITKPNEEIRSFINKTIARKRQQYLNKYIEMKTKNNKNEKNNNISANNKENNTINYNIKLKLGRNSSTLKSTDANNQNSSVYLKCNISHNNSINVNNNTIKIMKPNEKFLKILPKNNYSQNISKSCEIIRKNNNASIYNQNKNLRNACSTKDNVIKYPLDKFNFSRNYIKKKNYIDKCFDKEINFHKKLLGIKKYELQTVPDLFNLNRVIESAKREFDMIFNVEKCKINDKHRNNINNLLNRRQLNIIDEMKNEANNAKNKKDNKSNLKIKKEFVKIQPQRRGGVVDFDQSKIVLHNNEEKMKNLNAECEELSNKRRRTNRERRNIITNTKKCK